MQLSCYDSVGDLVKTFQCIKITAQKRFYPRNTFNNVLEIVCFEYNYLSEGIDFRTVNVETRNDAESALAADEQLLEVVAGVVLHYLGPHVEHFPAWQHRLDPQNVGAEGAELNDVFASGVCGRVAAHHARAFGAEVERSFTAFGLEELAQPFEDNAGLHIDHRTHGVKLLDFVHVFQADDDFVEDGHAAPNESGVSSLRHHCQYPLVAVPQNLRHLLSVLRTQQQLRVSLIIFSKA